MTVFDSTKSDYKLNAKMFLDVDGGVNVARYDQMKYPQFDILTDKQLGFFWRPNEVALSKDAKDFKSLSVHEQHIFTSNLKRQILLDSVQGRAPLTLLPIISLPELETWTVTWTFSEQIHNRSYTHIIRNIYANPSPIFDEILKIEEIVNCAKDISKYYDDLHRLILAKQMIEEFGIGMEYYNEYELKKALWMCLHSINALEGVRFYVSFACSWAFAELQKMEGNAKIIKFICRDENLHLAATQKLIKILPEDDPDFVKIEDECREACTKLFKDVVEQEKQWADYLFKDGSMIGLNADVLKEYVDFIAHRRMKIVGLEPGYKIGSNPLPWTEKWIAGQNVQVAPQETEITSYTIGAVNMDVNEDTFSGFEL